jgi:hypothetical protein
VQGEGPLLTIAEVSVALAGFSSVVIALRGVQPHAWSAQDRVGLGNVLAVSLGTLVGSLVPFPLAYLGASEALVWGVSTGAVGLFILAGVGTLAFAAIARQVRPRTPRVFWTIVPSGFVVAPMLLLSSLDVLFPRGPSLLLVGLIWALVGAFAQLASFVLVTWSGDS